MEYQPLDRSWPRFLHQHFAVVVTLEALEAFSQTATTAGSERSPYCPPQVRTQDGFVRRAKRIRRGERGKKRFYVRHSPRSELANFINGRATYHYRANFQNFTGALHSNSRITPSMAAIFSQAICWRAAQSSGPTEESRGCMLELTCAAQSVELPNGESANGWKTATNSRSPAGEKATAIGSDSASKRRVLPA